VKPGTTFARFPYAKQSLALFPPQVFDAHLPLVIHVASESQIGAGMLTEAVGVAALAATLSCFCRSTLRGTPAPTRASPLSQTFRGR